ncbi:hypothetical protein [Thermaurantiacus sp.]
MSVSLDHRAGEGFVSALARAGGSTRTRTWRSLAPLVAANPLGAQPPRLPEAPEPDPAHHRPEARR